jgi:hypothetical protein
MNSIPFRCVDRARVVAVTAIVVAALFPAVCRAQNAVHASGSVEAAPMDAVALFESANADFRAAVDCWSKDSAEASRLAARAAASYREVALRTGVRNHRLELNAGNASLVAGDLGHAVSAYRRAERLAPADPLVRASLDAARARVGLTFVPDLRARAREVLLAWRGRVSPNVLWTLGFGAYGAAWALGAFRLLGARRIPAWVGVSAGVLALVCGTALAVDELDRRSSRDAVISASEVVARSGPGSPLYPQSFTQPLRAGVECTLLEVRDAWCRVRLIDGRETWVPGASLDRV